MTRKKPKNDNSGDLNHHDIPSSLKKFRQSPEIEGFYRFIYENDLRIETFEIIDKISQKRQASKIGKKKSKIRTT